MDKIRSAWLEALRRESGIRKAILLYGDIFDVYSSPIKPHTYEPIQSVICSALSDRGFSDIILWDSFEGVKNITPERWDELQKDMLESAMGANAGSKDTQSYDMGDTDLNESANANSGTVPPNIDDFLSVVHFYLTNKTEKRVAFVLDWSQYLFTANASLSEEDRKRLLMLSKSINGAPLAFGSRDDMKNPCNLLVLITSKLGCIPSIFYQGNVCVKEIAVPGPSRTERETFLDAENSKWNLSENPMFTKSKFADFVDATEGFSIRDLIQLARLSQQSSDSLTAEKLINLYRYGEEKSHWEDLSKEKLSKISEKLKERVKGQDFAIDKLKQVIIRAYSGLAGVQHSKKQKMPKGALFFVGPTGVGKTELAKALAEFLFGDEEACIRFDMSEFNHEHSDQRLVGAPPDTWGTKKVGS